MPGCDAWKAFIRISHSEADELLFLVSADLQPHFAAALRGGVLLPGTKDPNARFMLVRNKEPLVGIVWTIIIGFVAGLIAKFIVPGRNEPRGFVLTAILGIVGALVASYLGQALHIYAPGEGAGLFGAVVGAVIVLIVWGMIARRRA
jgi:uncharacterized membrane protein YeaQ/YmgE (transglycosylase-associated protein family)